MSKVKTPSLSLNRYRSVWEMRDDGWIVLTDGMGRLMDMKPVHAAFEKQRASVEAALMLLAPIEGYWAFPDAIYSMTSFVGLKKAITFVPTKRCAASTACCQIKPIATVHLM